MTEPMQEIIERIKRLTYHDREIDALICNLIYGKQSWWSPSVEWCRLYHARPTGSIDAARALVPKGWSYNVGENEPRTNAQAVLGRSYPTNKTITQEANTPALALASAALRARLTTEKKK